MNSRTRSRSPASIGSNQSSRRWTAASASDCRVGDVVLLLVMAQSPPVCANAGIVWVSAPGDYAILNSNHTPDGTCRSDAKGEIQIGGPYEGESTDAGHRGGATRSSDEGPVMGLERRG